MMVLQNLIKPLLMKSPHCRTPQKKHSESILNLGWASGVAETPLLGLLETSLYNGVAKSSLTYGATVRCYWGGCRWRARPQLAPKREPSIKRFAHLAWWEHPNLSMGHPRRDQKNRCKFGKTGVRRMPVVSRQHQQRA